MLVVTCVRTGVHTGKKKKGNKRTKKRHTGKFVDLHRVRTQNMDRESSRVAKSLLARGSNGGEVEGV
jgi:hypothetical protein